MRVTKEQAEQNRIKILEAASRLFRRSGIEGVGVAEIAKEAGLTHGALYAHFPSKNELAAEAFSYGFNANMASSRERSRGLRHAFADHLAGLLSPRMRDNAETGCPMAASASEIGRQEAAVCRNFARAFEELVAVLEASLGDSGMSSSNKRRLAVTATAAQIGAIAVSRALAKVDPELSDEVLQSVKETLTKVCKSETHSAR